MRRHLFVSAGFGILLMTTQNVQAKDHEKWTHFGLRPMAMGNAYVAVADDFNALFYNPAGLARIKEWDGEFLNPALDSSAKLGSLAKDAQDKLKDGSVSSTLDLIESNTGENYHFGQTLTPHLIFPHFGFGIGEELSATMVFHRDISVNFDAGLRLIIPFSYAMNFLDDKLSLGATLKGRARAGVDREFSMEDIESFNTSSTDTNKKQIDDYVLSGVGYGADLGMLFTPTKVMEPTLGMSITDFGGTPYKSMNIAGKSLGKPPAELPSVNVGFSLKPIQRDRLYVLSSIDMHSINQPYSFSKKLSLGTELGYGSIIKLQAGLYQGYLTAGFQFDVGLINLRFTTYSEELGAVAGYKEDRRYALQIKLLI
ncbi:MAG: hypothetical protein NTX25_00690 [Proteobacteria bacterium]|nr:hypothetical protein [Pseudomonadota bacterium]